jgi:hypothetical protein
MDVTHSDLSQNRAYNGYKELIQFVPALRKALLELEHDELTIVISSVRRHVSSSCSFSLVPVAQRGAQCLI